MAPIGRDLDMALSQDEFDNGALVEPFRRIIDRSLGLLRDWHNEAGRVVLGMLGCSHRLSRLAAVLGLEHAVQPVGQVVGEQRRRSSEAIEPVD